LLVDVHAFLLGKRLGMVTSILTEERMNAEWIITAFDLIVTLLSRLDHPSHKLAQVPDSEILIVAVVAAKYFQNHYERAVCVLREAHYLSGRLDLTRFNRWLHKLADIVAFVTTVLGEVLMQGEVFVIDSIPLPVCRRVRARRCRSSCMARGRFPSTPTLVVGIMRPQRHDGIQVIAPLTLVLARAETTTRPVTTWQQTRPSVSLLRELRQKAGQPWRLLSTCGRSSASWRI
jgi:hypothetical protein